ncbi:enterochelin esterase [Microbulbifer epialgicus]|uniref:Enterochelin esterase n=1 Tax=Microbulbifer epialgicus TaxID=393907 RepID=A0ABV4P2V3_9GAMM
MPKLCEVGSASWWSEVKRLGLPLLSECPSDETSINLTFLWRDPNGSEFHSPIKRVYIDINCVTDHHTFSPPSLKRLPGTDVWHWQMEVEKNWRGSYRLIPTTGEWVGTQREKELSPNEDKHLMQRHWWRSLLKAAIPDPLNRQAPNIGQWGRKFSAVHLPDAPMQSSWQKYDLKLKSQESEGSFSGKLKESIWQSTSLKVSRRIWTYTSGEAPNPEQRPLIILLDGDRWAKEMPIFSVLEEQTHSGNLPPALYLLIDPINGHQRERDLTCSEKFWLAVQQELIPQVKKEMPHTTNPAHTVIAGQSYGGLAALYAGLNWPTRFGCILSQSGSFWWPNIGLIRKGNQSNATGWLTKCVIQDKFSPSGLRIFQQVGTRENKLSAVNAQLKDILISKHFDVEYQNFIGGHDTLCWRDGLIKGISYLLKNFSYQD